MTPPNICAVVFRTFEIIPNHLSTAITEQYRAYLGTIYGREKLNECLTDRYVLIDNEVEFARFGK